jgi:hypothetical protein
MLNFVSKDTEQAVEIDGFTFNLKILSVPAKLSLLEKLQSIDITEDDQENIGKVNIAFTTLCDALSEVIVSIKGIEDSPRECW